MMLYMINILEMRLYLDDGGDELNTLGCTGMSLSKLTFPIYVELMDKRRNLVQFVVLLAVNLFL